MVETRCDFCHSKCGRDDIYGKVAIPKELYAALSYGSPLPRKQKKKKEEEGVWISLLGGVSTVREYDACGECLRQLVLMREHVMETLAKVEG